MAAEVTDAGLAPPGYGRVERLRGITVSPAATCPAICSGGTCAGGALMRRRSPVSIPAFHHTLPELARRLPIPGELGMRAMAIHGLNYAYIASTLPSHLGELAQGRIVVAHLGGGGSLCLLVKSEIGRYQHGLHAGRRHPDGHAQRGDLDPGVHAWNWPSTMTAKHWRDLVYHRMGLLRAVRRREPARCSACWRAQASRPICRGLLLPPGTRRHRRLCRKGWRH